MVGRKWQRIARQLTPEGKQFKWQMAKSKWQMLRAEKA
jgi:hypothetical protein